MRDPLYLIFEQHLFTALVEDESIDEFLTRVVADYLVRLGGVIPAGTRAALESDLRDEVLEMFRKKTYGHYNLSSFRKANGVEVTPSADLDFTSARRGGRAC